MILDNDILKKRLRYQGQMLTQAADRIEELESAIKYATDYLDDNELNTIGHKSKAHQELLSVLEDN